MKVKIGKYEYEKSTKKGKKLMVKVNNKTIHFGNINYQHFKDKTGLLPKSLNHGDKKRRDNYYSRHGEATSKDSAKYWSHKILW